MNRRRVGMIVLMLSLACSAVVGWAAINKVLLGGEVNVTELQGSVQYTSNPFSVWGSTLNITSGVAWRTRVLDLMMDYSGSVNLTWTLMEAGADNIIHTGDDVAIPTASFDQMISVVSGVGQTVVASSDGFNPYNWGQWTDSPMKVYVKLDMVES